MGKSDKKKSKSGNPAVRAAEQITKDAAVDLGAPIVLTRSGGDEVKDVVLFIIDGKEYGMPDRTKVGLSMEFFSIRRTQGDAGAVSWLLEKALPEKTFRALMDYPDLDEGLLEAVALKVQAVVFGKSAPKA